MSEADRLRELLPSLYRPESGDQTLLARLLAASGLVLDDVGANVQHVLRSHWFDTADSALWDAHYQTARAERGLSAVNVRLDKDQKEVLTYPYVADLARVASVLNLPPWLEPTAFREGVEEYRGRIADLVDAYRLGVTTLPALRRLVEAALPEDLGAPLAQQRWPFSIEEPVALATRRTQIIVPHVEEGDQIGPLHRFTLDRALGEPRLTFACAGPEPTLQPAFELFTPGERPAGVALGYLGTLAPGQALRLLPARSTLLVADGTLSASAPDSLETAAGDPSVNGPFAPLAGVPAGVIRRAARALDHTLWLVLEDAGSFRLYRYDGREFLGIDDGAPAAAYSSVLVRGTAVYLGTALGLFSCELFPESGAGFELRAVAAVPEIVHALSALNGDRVGCAGANGVAVLELDDSVSARLLAGTSVHALTAHGEQIFLATEQALLLLDGARLYRYEGAALSEDRLDWIAIEPALAPTAVSPLPAVRELAVSVDGSLWLGTVRGLARYGVRADTITVCEAFPDLGGGAIACLFSDARGMLWVAGAPGLFRFDGRELLQFRFDEGRWASLGRADTVYPDDSSAEPRGHFRFDVASAQWQRFDARLGRFMAAPLSVRAEPSPSVELVLGVPSLRAELGHFDGSEFSDAAPAALDQFVMHVKPDESRIVNGGLPALPSASGNSAPTYRYLELEPADLVAPEGRPWWSREGRLFLPPQLGAPWPGHFRDEAEGFQSDGHFDAAVFAYPPTVRLWLEHLLLPQVGVRVRINQRNPSESVDPALLERVWRLLIRGKPAGVPLELAVEGRVVHSTLEGG